MATVQTGGSKEAINKDRAMYGQACKTRTYLRSRITRLYNLLTPDDALQDLTVVRAQEYHSQLIKLENDLSDNSLQVNSVLPADVDLDNLIAEEDVYNDRIAATKRAFKSSN